MAKVTRRLISVFSVVAILAIFSVSFRFGFAEEFTSSSFRVLDPVLAPSGFSSSTSFQLFSSLAELAIGTSTASSFTLGSGFLLFPQVDTPAVSATAGAQQVALSWTASTGYLGWTVNGYDVGQATVSGGPYSYTSLGNVLSSTRTGLTASVPYYFVIRPLDVFGNALATSTEVTATPTASSGGGGGGGGGGSSSDTEVILIGRAYPLSRVTVLKDGQVAITTIAGPDAKFNITVGDLNAGSYIFAVYAEDEAGRRSSLFTFPLTLTNGASTQISGIFLAPTIAVDKSEVKQGDNIAIFGQAQATSSVTIAVNSLQPFFATTTADVDGVYLYNFDTVVLELGDHSTKAKSTVGNEISSFSQTVAFKVGDQNVLPTPGACPAKADLNNDCRVNLVDFSIAAYWYHRPLSVDFAVKEKDKLNGDNQINLVDFSIMAYYWTG